MCIGKHILISVLCSITLLSSELTCAAEQNQTTQDLLAAGFAQPPAAAKPRVWWHWMNGNITKVGIKLDLEWMQRIGIGGFQNFDASLGTPQVVEQRLAYMTPEWQDAFSYTTQLADQLGLEMAIAGSPGWSETGGPWVKPEQAMKKLVWSETRIAGGKSFNGQLPKPPTTSGPFQHMPHTELALSGRRDMPHVEFYADTAVIAYRAPTRDVSMQRLAPEVTTNNGVVPLNALIDGNGTTQVTVPMSGDIAWIQYAFAQPQTIHGVTFGVEHAGLPLIIGGIPEVAELQVSDDGVQFQKVANLTAIRGGLSQDIGQGTTALPSTTARFFRVVMSRPKPLQSGPEIDLSAFGMPAIPPPTEFKVNEFVLQTQAVINRFEDKAAFAVGTDLYAAATPAAPADTVIAQQDVIDLTAKMRADGSLNWQPPGDESSAEWIVLRMGYSLTGACNSPASNEATGLEVDKLNRSAVRDYLENYLDQYKRASGGLMGRRGLEYMITDSWEAGAQNWTNDMMAEFKRRRGYDMRAWLPVLTGRVVQSAADSDRFLWDFRTTLGELLIDNHYTQIAQSLRQRGMGLYSESHESGRAFIGDGMQVKRGASVPMGAMWTQLPGVDNEQYGYNADIRESASVAHIYGQNLVAAESFTAGSGAWAWAPEYLKSTADKELAMGLNRFIIHTSVHQPVLDKQPGLGLGPFGQWFTRNETWAEQAGPWIQYLARSSYLLQQGRFVADVAYYYGEDANVTALFAKTHPPVPAGYNFDFINADVLRNVLQVNKGELITPSGMRYRVLALDDNAHHMSLPVLRKLAKLVAAGAVVVGERPTSPSLADDEKEYARLVKQLWGEGGEHRVGKGVVYSGRSLDDVLRMLNINADFEHSKPQSDTHLLFVHRQLSDGELYFVDSRNDRQQQVEASFRVAGKQPELWHADTGVREAVSYRVIDGRTIVPLSLQPYEAVFVVFRKNTAQLELTLPTVNESVLATLSTTWGLSFQPHRGAPEKLQWNALQSWSESSDAGIKYFSGTGTYTQTVMADASWFKANTRLWLDLGKVMNIADVRVNGQPLGIVWKAPFRVDVSDVLKPGTNQLEIKVTNLWVNRLIGDQQPNAQTKYTFTTQAFYKADSPLLPSGLLGPVQLIAQTSGQ